MKTISTTTCRNKKTNEYIRHEYPTTGTSHPFDINCTLQYFLFAEGYTYLMEENKTKLIPAIKKVIPKSYMPFAICERCLMIYKGNIAWTNPNYKNIVLQDELENYKILALYKEKIDAKHYSSEIKTTKDLLKDLDEIKDRSHKSDNIYMLVKVL